MASTRDQDSRSLHSCALPSITVLYVDLAVAACDTNCASGCDDLGAGKCDTECNYGYVLTTDDICAGKYNRLFSAQFKCQNKVITTMVIRPLDDPT